ncbi:RING zinc finger protein [Chloropicon primus]|nr:RING zinc finger protein [Chloropicon primus]
MSEECLICAEPLDYVSVLPCGHADVCPLCTIRLRTIIGDKRCCACQKEAEKVVVRRCKRAVEEEEEFPSDFDAGVKRGSLFPLKGSRDVCFDSKDLRNEMNSRCSLSCVVCKKEEEEAQDTTTEGEKKRKKKIHFGTLKALKRHLREDHGLYMCEVCLEGRKVFVQEQILYTRSELKRHCKRGDAKGVMADSGFSGHPSCKFCKKHFYSTEELYVHMQTKHLQCFLCRRANPSDQVYYRNLSELSSHFASSHHFCTHESCKGRHPEEMVFRTKEDLRVHEVQYHGESLSRNEKRQALQISVEYPSLRQDDGGGQEPGRGRRGRDRGSSRRRGGTGGAATSLSSQATPFVPGGGGIIDDDIGLLADHSARNYYTQQRAQRVSDFPPLASPPSPEADPGEAPRQNWLQRAQAPGGPHPLSLPKRANSGGGAGVLSHEDLLIQKLESLVVEEPSVMEERRKRKQMLADAFGVSDPDRPSQFSTPSVVVPDDVVLYAAKHLDFVLKVERVVQYFSLQISKRLPLPPMNREQRKVVHVVCNLCKVVSQAYGAEPNRCVNLIRNPTGSQVPTESLSTIAKAKLEGREVETLVEEARWEIKLVDIEPELKLRELLVYQMKLDPELQVEVLKERHPKNLKSALVRFSSLHLFKEAKSQLGGGMRGKFVVDMTARSDMVLKAVKET